jgi:phospholipase C
VFFLTYDEGGGFFDHVAPPKACVPDQIKPNLQPGDYHADFDRYGIRVPFVAISPFAKHHYVSHRTQDHTSILKFIEMKFNLPALTDRDANADDLLSMFDWKHPDYETVPNFSLATVDGTCD